MAAALCSVHPGERAAVRDNPFRQSASGAMESLDEDYTACGVESNRNWPGKTTLTAGLIGHQVLLSLQESVHLALPMHTGGERYGSRRWS